MALPREVWIAEVIKKLRLDGSFMKRMADYSRYVVGTKTIHMRSIGADPAVLIDNTTYPIAVAARTDTDVAITLSKFDTENTSVSDEDLETTDLDIVATVLEQHIEVIMEKMALKAAHAIAPAANAALTPVIKTTGANGVAQKGMSFEDLIKAQYEFTKQRIPNKDRILVLSAQHVADLLKEDKDLYKNHTVIVEGQIIPRIYGFDVYEFDGTALYDATFNKKAFDALLAPSTDRPSSLAFWGPGVFKAQGQIKIYRSVSDDDPLNRETVIGVRSRFVALPKTASKVLSIVNDDI